MAAKKKRSRGRPPLDPGEHREVTVTLRVRREDAERMKSAAKRDGKTFSEWARMVLTSAAPRR